LGEQSQDSNLEIFSNDLNLDFVSSDLEERGGILRIRIW